MIETSSDWASGIGDLEARLYRQLEIPVESLNASACGPGAGPRPDSISVALRELRRELFELHREAARIGKLPEHYPRHVVLVMKAISALLPWYTRPLAHFGHRAARTAEAIARLLDEVLRKQEALAMEVARLKKGGIGSNGFHIGIHRDLDR